MSYLHNNDVINQSCLKCLQLLLLSRLSRVQLCATPETAAHQDPPSLGFSRQEHWSGVPLPSLALSVYVCPNLLHSSIKLTEHGNPPKSG